MKYDIYISTSNPKLRKISNALGKIITNLEGNQIVVKEMVATIESKNNKPLTDEEITTIKTAITDKAKELLLDIVSVDVEPHR